MEILFLGTSGSVPTVERGSPCVALKRNGELIFFDCGEGTQRQLAFTNLRYGRLSKILITHLHGDHVLGLGGLLQTLSLSGRTKPLQIFGPLGIGGFLEALAETLHFAPSFDLVVNQTRDAGNIFENDQYVIRVCKTDHEGIFSLAYSLEEKWRPGEFFPERATRLGVPEGPLWRKLQYGESVTLANGNTVDPEMVVGPRRPGRKVVYSGDTRPTNEIVSLSLNADILIHDSTYDDSLLDKAAEYGHSTASQAAKVAKEANVRLLVLTHISNRYSSDQILLEQARAIFRNTIVAKDFLNITVPAAGATS
ncbi:MAG: ribonuclease Z [Promethearchaeati archaeon SRVP18_Atabeyarchaeia-1]